MNVIPTSIMTVKPLHLRGLCLPVKSQVLAMGHSAGLFKCEQHIFGENGFGKMNYEWAKAVINHGHQTSCIYSPKKRNALLSYACVGESGIIKSPSGCRLKKNLLSANEIDTSPVQGHCS